MSNRTRIIFVVIIVTPAVNVASCFQVLVGRYAHSLTLYRDAGFVEG